MTEQEVRVWARCVYGSTTYSHKMRFITHNDKYVLMQKPPSTEYIGRMSGSVYSESEWMLVPFDCGKEVSYSPEKVSVFYKIGKLTKEDKEKLEKEFGIVIPKKEKNNKIKEDKWVVIFDSTHFGFGSFYENDVVIAKLLKEDSKTVIASHLGKSHSYSKQKHLIAYFDVEKDAVNALFKVINTGKEYERLCIASRQKSQELKDIFNKPTSEKEEKE